MIRNALLLLASAFLGSGSVAHHLASALPAMPSLPLPKSRPVRGRVFYAPGSREIGETFKDSRGQEYIVREDGSLGNVSKTMRKLQALAGSIGEHGFETQAKGGANG